MLYVGFASPSLSNVYKVLARASSECLLPVGSIAAGKRLKILLQLQQIKHVIGHHGQDTGVPTQAQEARGHNSAAQTCTAVAALMREVHFLGPGLHNAPE